MERYIGLDAHGQSCTFGVMGPSGRKIRHDVVETNGAALVRYVKGLPGAEAPLPRGGHAERLALRDPLAPRGGDRGGRASTREAGVRRAMSGMPSSGPRSCARTGSRRRSSRLRGASARLRELSRVHSMLVRGRGPGPEPAEGDVPCPRGLPTPGKTVYSPRRTGGMAGEAAASCRTCHGPALRGVRRPRGAEEGSREGAGRRGGEAADREDPGHGTRSGADPDRAAAAGGRDTAPVPHPEAVLGLLRFRHRAALLVGLGPDRARRLGASSGSRRRAA